MLILVLRRILGCLLILVLKTVPLSTSDSEIQTTPALSVDFGIQTDPPPSCANVETQTIPAMSMADAVSQGPRDLVDVIRDLRYALAKQQDNLFETNGSDYEIEKISKIWKRHWDLEKWLLADGEKAREQGLGPIKTFGQHCTPSATAIQDIFSTVQPKIDRKKKVRN